MPSSIRDILTNREVIAINQDPLGKQGQRLSQSGHTEIWVRELAGGAKAVALFNRGGDAAKVTVRWADAGIKGTPHARDLWSHQDVTVNGPDYSATVPSHGVMLLRVSK